MTKTTIYTLTALSVLVLFLFGFRTPKPKVFVIGDSISIQYGPYLKESLMGFFEYDRKRGRDQALQDLDQPVGANGGDSGRVLAYLKKLRDSSEFHTDFLLINCGLHDIKTKPSTGELQISLERYRRNLDSIIDLSSSMGVRLVWATTTPVVDSVHNRKSSFHRFAKDVRAYNEVAEELMEARHVPIIDLYTFTAKFGPGAFKDHVHYGTGIREKQADFIAGFLHNLIDKK